MNAPMATATLSQLREVSAPRPIADVSVGFTSAQGFDLLQRGAKLLAASTLVPQQFQGNLPNCVIALNMAQRMGADPLLVMQNLYVVHGRPGWSSQFLIATFNQNGRYTALRYEFFGERGKSSWGCRAWAIEKSTEEKLVGADVTIEIADKEGWSKKSGSKWQTMPQQMLMYRAASWFIRAYAPEIAMGLQTREEIVDTIDLNPDGSYSVTTDDLGQPKESAKPPPEAEDATERNPAPERQALSFAQVMDRIEKAATGDALDEAVDLIRQVADEDQAEELRLRAAERRGELA